MNYTYQHRLSESLQSDYIAEIINIVIKAGIKDISSCKSEDIPIIHNILQEITVHVPVRRGVDRLKFQDIANGLYQSIGYVRYTWLISKTIKKDRFICKAGISLPISVESLLFISQLHVSTGIVAKIDIRTSVHKGLILDFQFKGHKNLLYTFSPYFNNIHGEKHMKVIHLIRYIFYSMAPPEYYRVSNYRKEAIKSVKFLLLSDYRHRVEKLTQEANRLFNYKNQTIRPITKEELFSTGHIPQQYSNDNNLTLSWFAGFYLGCGNIYIDVSYTHTKENTTISICSNISFVWRTDDFVFQFEDKFKDLNLAKSYKFTSNNISASKKNPIMNHIQISVKNNPDLLGIFLSTLPIDTLYWKYRQYCILVLITAIIQYKLHRTSTGIICIICILRTIGQIKYVSEQVWKIRLEYYEKSCNKTILSGKQGIVPKFENKGYQTGWHVRFPKESMHLTGPNKTFYFSDYNSCKETLMIATNYRRETIFGVVENILYIMKIPSTDIETYKKCVTRITINIYD